MKKAAATSSAIATSRRLALDGGNGGAVESDTAALVLKARLSLMGGRRISAAGFSMQE
jgi:hypothetical protein